MRDDALPIVSERSRAFFGACEPADFVPMIDLCESSVSVGPLESVEFLETCECCSGGRLGAAPTSEDVAEFSSEAAERVLGDAEFLSLSSEQF